MCPLTGEYVGHMGKVCKTCKYPFCSRNTTVAPPQEQGDSDGSGSEVDREVDSRHGGKIDGVIKNRGLEFEADRKHILKEELDDMVKGTTELISKELQFGIDNKQHTVRPIQGLTSTGISMKFNFSKEQLFYGSILFHLKEELDQMGLHLSLINTEHNEKIIVISQNHSPIDGAYIMTREPTE